MSKDPKRGTIPLSTHDPVSESSTGDETLNLANGQPITDGASIAADTLGGGAKNTPATAPLGNRGLDIGERLDGKYEIIGLLGVGGMGQVYKARHIDLGNLVAIKVMNSNLIQDADAIERFKREARASAKIVHSNAVRILDYGTRNDLCYLVMEYLEGESLRKRLSNGVRLPLLEVLSFAEQVCLILEVIHRKGIIHRDLKPDNFFFHKQEEGEIVKLLDFGIVKVMDDSTQAQATLTRPGALIGTPSYMSPEQCQGDKIDNRSDIYSLGIIIYEMLAGSPPFEAENSLVLMFKQVNDPPPPLHEVAPDLPRALSEVLERALSKNPADRYRSAKEFFQELYLAASLDKADSPSPGKAKPKKAARKEMPQLSYKTAGILSVNTGNISSDKTLEIEQPSNRKHYWLISVILLLSMGLAGLAAWHFYPELARMIGVESGSETTKLPAPALPQMVSIAGGKFLMGSDKGDKYASPQHEVEVAPFNVSKFLITNRQYNEFVKEAHHQAPAFWQGPTPPATILEEPVTDISWYDANAYCVWLTTQTGKSYRLPSEKEWEYLAGRSTNFGVEEMLGKYLEWTSTEFSYYPGSKIKDLLLPVRVRVFRGKSKEYTATEPITFRMWQKEDATMPYLGFRVAHD